MRDIAIIGGGPAGYVVAIRAAQLGLNAALIDERQSLGGTCLNIGCIPSKALLDSSEFYYKIRQSAASHGISISDATIDIGVMQQRKRKVVAKLVNGVDNLVSANGVTRYVGSAAFQSANSLMVTKSDHSIETIEARNIVIATGSVPRELPDIAIDHRIILDSTDALELDVVPSSMLVIGAGAIGLELGSVWSRLGSSVTVVEMMPEILPGFDAHIAKTARSLLKKQGLDIRLSTRVVEARIVDDKALVTIAYSANGKEQSKTISVDKILVAVGRVAYNEHLNLNAAGVISLEKGRIKVDSLYRSSISSIYAIGDVIAGPMLAHKAEEEGIALAEIIAGRAGHVSYRAIPNVVYTSPEVASVGLTEERLIGDGRNYKAASFPFAANGRAISMGEPHGMVRIYTDSESDELLGAHIVGPWASILIAEIVAVMEYRGSAEDVARICHAHPTLSEAVREAALGIDGRAIHKFEKR